MGISTSRHIFGLALLLVFAGSAQAGTLLIPTDPLAKRPASDLIQQGRNLDEAEVTRLIRDGVPIDTLSPQESILFTQRELPRIDPSLAQAPSDHAVVHFDSLLASPRGLFRSSVDHIDATGQARAYTLTISLNYSAAVVRASILRRMGYPVTNPKPLHALKVRFQSVAARDDFLEKLADRSLTSRTRWIKHLPENEPEVTLQGAVLEPGRISVQTVHWGLLTAALQRERRVFRALLLPFILADIPEKVNQYAWTTGRIFNGGIWLEYLFSEAFPDVTYPDLKWAARRIARLRRDELVAAVRDARLPADITALLAEKLVARRNSMVELFGLQRDFPMLPCDEHLSTGNVQNGQLIEGGYEGYPQDFHQDAALPPLRFSQLWRYFLTQGISAAISEGLNQINTNLLTLSSEGTAGNQHRTRIDQGINDYLIRGPTQSDGYQTGAWAWPTAGVSVNASRSIVAGSLLGSDSSVQMVDSVSAEANAGVFFGFDTVQQLSLSTHHNVVGGRSYTHIRPIADVHTALVTNWGRLAVTAFMAELGSSLDPDIECTIPEEAFTSEFVVDGQTYFRVKYDKERPNGREEAMAVRQQLIDSGTPADRIVLGPFDRRADCTTEVDTAIAQNLERFMEGLAVGESFVVSDYIRFGNGISANIAIPLVEFLNLSVGVSGDKDYQVTRSTLIQKTANGFQIYLQDRNTDDYSAGLDINLYINLINTSRTERFGRGSTEFFNIVTEGATTETKRNVIRALKALLLGNSSEVLMDHFHPFHIEHNLSAQITRFRFLAWSHDTSSQRHEVDIYPPYDPQNRYDRERHRRTLHMSRSVVRDGEDIVGFGLRSIGSIVPFLGGLSSGLGIAGSNDPGNAILGSSVLRAVSVQGEVTNGRELNPVGMIEQTYRGWSMGISRLYDVFREIEEQYQPLAATRPLFRREIFSQASSLQLYQIETTLVVYPRALNQLVDVLMRPRSHREAFSWLAERFGWRRLRFQCQLGNRVGSFMPMPNIWYGDPSGTICSLPWMSELMRMRVRGISSDPRQRLADYQRILVVMVKNIGAAEVLRQLDPQDYFFLSRVSGFRGSDSNGALEYVADTVGKFDNELGMGIYRDLSSGMGLSAFEIYGRFFTDGL
jgi:hypothetical protein